MVYDLFDEKVVKSDNSDPHDFTLLTHIQRHPNQNCFFPTLAKLVMAKFAHWEFFDICYGKKCSSTIFMKNF